MSKIFFVEDVENHRSFKCETDEEVKRIFEDFYNETPLSYEEMPLKIYQVDKPVSPKELGIKSEEED